MSFATAHNELRGRFNTQWNNATPVAWPNVDFTPPTPTTIWCRFNIIDGSAIYDHGTQTTIGAVQNNQRYVGSIIIQLFGPLNKGNNAILAKADTALAIFHNWGGTNIQTRQGVVKDIGNDGNGWYQVNVVIPFVRNELI